MKQVTLALLLSAAFSAHAGQFQEINTKVETCNFFGDFAGRFYDMRMRGEPPIPKKDGGTHMDLIKLYAIDYAWGDATSKIDARQHVLMKCLDNYDWAVSSDRMQLARPEKLHY